ncbi:hypothetical protein SEA_AFLAC_77 [Gordonia phage Aflac]|uniref:Uncharacterized protein n=1 Tax=Gordonia phage Duffington TaxID=2507858 RepID=A0A410TCM8_9CAUD|nr:hypothetical protein HWC06_gp77 [Gordonia phage Duffington]QAU06782.1 hypothetical protein SEA_DUFFINGTON_77 [Gordonia phage Duffington]QWY82409.1 hypothetical protein SEA_AFLAC_77 [Gordonia phage Aflac]WNT45153.1 hypothetical protein SEA_OLGASCLOVER_79 [Gordonia phage OlgasClover]
MASKIITHMVTGEKRKIVRTAIDPRYFVVSDLNGRGQRIMRKSTVATEWSTSA